jgi:hypothetical protein
MKKNLIKYYIATFYLCSTFVMFAQTDPGTGGGVENDGSTDTTPAAAPINDYIWALALVGLLIVFMKFRAIQKNKINS